MKDNVNPNRVFFIPDHPDAIMSKELNIVYRDVINESLSPELTPIEYIDPIMRVTVDVSTHARDLDNTINVIRDFEGIVFINLTAPASKQVRVGNVDMGPMQWSRAFSGDGLTQLYAKLNSTKAKVIILHGSFSTAAMGFLSRGVLVVNDPVAVDVRSRRTAL